MTDIDKTPTLNELNDTFTVGNRTYASKFEDDVRVDRMDLNNEFTRQPERFAFYATCYELAAIHAERYDITLKRLYASLDQEKRNELRSNGIKFTEKMVENSVITDDRYVAMHEEVIEAQKHAALLKVAMTAMIQRKDMLIQLGSSARAEMASDLSVKGEATRRSNTR